MNTIGPDDSDSGWNDFRDFKFAGKSSLFSYSDSSEQNMHSPQVFPDVDDQDLPEKM